MECCRAILKAAQHCETGWEALKRSLIERAWRTNAGREQLPKVEDPDAPVPTWADLEYLR